jgi:hypothetical protein
MWCLAQTAESKPRLIGLAKILRLLGALSASSAWKKEDRPDKRGSGVGVWGGSFARLAPVDRGTCKVLQGGA